MSNSNLTWKQLLAFSAPSIPLAILMVPTASILPTFYATHTTLTLEAIGFALFLSRLLDAVTDPVVGFLSDRIDSRFGKRKPWLVAGVFLCAVSAVNYFSPPESASFTYFLGWLVLLSISWTLIGVPFSAWATELTHDYQERNKLYSVLSFVGGIGALVFFAVPLLPGFEGTEYSADVLKAMGWVVAIFLPLTIFYCVAVAPRGIPVPSKKISFSEILKSLKINKPFQIFIFISLLSGIAAGIQASVLFLYTDTYLGIGEYMPYILLTNFTAALLAVPVWAKIMKRLDKHKTWALGIAVGNIAMFPLFFISPGEEVIYLMLGLGLVGGFFQTATALSSVSIFADIVDYDCVKTGVHKAANLGSILALITKINIAFGSAAGFYLIGAFGYDVSGNNSIAAVAGLKFTFLLLPVLLGFSTLWFVWRFPIDKRRQRIIKRCLERNARYQTKQKFDQPLLLDD